MKGDTITTSSSSSTNSNYPPITPTFNSVDEDVTVNEMLCSVFKIPEKGNNNKNGTTINTAQLNRSHGRKEPNKFNSFDDGKDDTEFTAISKSRLKLPSFCKQFDQLQTID